MSDEPYVTDQIVDLLRSEGPLTMSRISTKLARNPGGIRQRLLRMAARGRLTAAIGADGWTVYGLPANGKEAPLAD